MVSGQESPMGEEVLSLLCKINLCRLDVDCGEDPEWLRGVSETLDAIYGHSRHLAVYGTLAPGQRDGERLSHLAGNWREGLVRGDLYQEGWGVSEGCPCLKWDPDGMRIPVSMLVSSDLPDEWPALDDFEGRAYSRILIPIENEQGFMAIANIYALREQMLAERHLLTR